MSADKDEYNFIHLKGGASIVYHLNPNKINLNNLTDDFDITIIQNKNDRVLIGGLLNRLFNKIQQCLQNYQLRLAYDNGLYSIYVNNIRLIDITIYDKNEQYDETSMINYASKKLNYGSFSGYIDSILLKIDDEKLFGVSNELLEIVTFTPLIFEYHAAIKGIENVIMYINRIPELTQRYEYLKKSNGDSYLIEKLKKNIDPIYIKKLHDKLERYKLKKLLIEKYNVEQK